LQKRLSRLDISSLRAYDLEAHLHMFHLPRAFRAGLHTTAAIEDGTLEYVEIAGNLEKIIVSDLQSGPGV